MTNATSHSPPPQSTNHPLLASNALSSCLHISLQQILARYHIWIEVQAHPQPSYFMTPTNWPSGFQSGWMHLFAYLWDNIAGTAPHTLQTPCFRPHYIQHSHSTFPKRPEPAREPYSPTVHSLLPQNVSKGIVNFLIQASLFTLPWIWICARTFNGYFCTETKPQRGISSSFEVY